MRIVSWNVNGIRSLAQKGFLEIWDSLAPDILCLQETKAHPDQLHEELAAPAGWNGYWSAAQRPGYSGTVTFSKQTPSNVEHGIGVRKFDAEGRIVRTDFPEFSLYNVYFPNGGARQERHLFKQEFLKIFSWHLRKRLQNGDKLIVLGDYNVAYLDLDVYDPKALATESGFLPEEREWMGQFLKDGFVDSFRKFHPHEENRFSWWSYFQNARVGNRGWRIDHICVSKNLEGALRNCDILDQQTGSDHCPIVLELVV